MSTCTVHRLEFIHFVAVCAVVASVANHLFHANPIVLELLDLNESVPILVTEMTGLPTSGYRSMSAWTVDWGLNHSTQLQNAESHAMCFRISVQTTNGTVRYEYYGSMGHAVSQNALCISELRPCW